MRSFSTALSRSPPVASSAFLQSPMPAPVRSRNSLTRAAVMGVLMEFPEFWILKKWGRSPQNQAVPKRVASRPPGNKAVDRGGDADTVPDPHCRADPRNNAPDDKNPAIPGSG